MKKEKLIPVLTYVNVLSADGIIDFHFTFTCKQKKVKKDRKVTWFLPYKLVQNQSWEFLFWMKSCWI
jgi:hypothetical protein